MIEWIESRRIETKSNKNGYVMIRFASRICDKCGKQEETRYGIIMASRKRRGGEEKDYCYKCAQLGRPMPKGQADSKWKHGKTYNGYVRICVNGRRILEHVHVMQEYMGRKLEKGETVHHIDMDKTNNKLDNLFLFKSQSEHQSCHISMEECGFELLNQFIWFNRDLKEYVLVRPVLEYNIKTFSLPCKKTFVMIRPSGQKYVYFQENGVRKSYHILLAELLSDRKLYKDEVVHHIDGNGENNDLYNLIVVTRKEHSSLCHSSLQKCVASLYKQRILGFNDGRYFQFQERVKNDESIESSVVSCVLAV